MFINLVPITLNSSFTIPGGKKQAVGNLKSIIHVGHRATILITGARVRVQMTCTLISRGANIITGRKLRGTVKKIYDYFLGRKNHSGMQKFEKKWIKTII